MGNYTFCSRDVADRLCSLLIGTVRRFLEKQKDKITAIVFCTSTTTDTEIYKRLTSLIFCCVDCTELQEILMK